MVEFRRENIFSCGHIDAEEVLQKSNKQQTTKTVKLYCWKLADADDEIYSKIGYERADEAEFVYTETIPEEGETFKATDVDGNSVEIKSNDTNLDNCTMGTVYGLSFPGCFGTRVGRFVAVAYKRYSAGDIS